VLALRKIQVTLPDGKTVDVPVEDSHGQWVDTTLADGTTVRVKTVVRSALRVGGEYPETNLMFPQKSGALVAIVRQIFAFLHLLPGRPKAGQPLPDPTFKS